MAAHRYLLVKNKYLRTLFFQVYGFFPELPALAKKIVLFPLSAMRYARQAIQYRRASADEQEFPFTFIDSCPLVYDAGDEAGSVPRHYFQMDLWAARKVHQLAPKKHVDIGSRLDGFVAHCASFSSLTMVDIRPLKEPIRGLEFVQGDATDLRRIPDGSVDCLSSLHMLDDIGFGRYGDPIDPNAFRRAIVEFQRVVKPGGGLIIAVPVGKPRIIFPGRVYSPETFVTYFQDCDLVEFSIEDDFRKLSFNTTLQGWDEQSHACGMFHFRKKL